MASFSHTLLTLMKKSIVTTCDQLYKPYVNHQHLVFMLFRKDSPSPESQVTKTKNSRCEHVEEKLNIL